MPEDANTEICAPIVFSTFPSLGERNFAFRDATRELSLFNSMRRGNHSDELAYSEGLPVIAAYD
jgi:hypothetical protein